jgi:hypothetical protein
MAMQIDRIISISLILSSNICKLLIKTTQHAHTVIIINAHWQSEGEVNTDSRAKRRRSETIHGWTRVYSNFNGATSSLLLPLPCSSCYGGPEASL